MKRTFEQTLSRVTAAAIEASQQEIALAFDIKFGSPTERLIGELGLYARYLATWTCAEEEFGDVRPLRDLLADAALTISIQAKLGTSAILNSSQNVRVERTKNSFVETIDEEALILLMLGELHANVPEADRPMSMSDLSDEQAERARRAVNAVVVRSLLSKPASRVSRLADIDGAA